jgi:FtsZ-interacting cell division protein YlmF
MGFMAGVWRMLGAEEDDAHDKRIVEYPVQTGRVAAEVTMAPAPPPVELAAAPAVPAAQTTICVVRPELDEDGEALFSLKEYAAHLLADRAVVLDINEIAAVDEAHAMRIVDYLSGVAEAVGGSVFEVTKNIFIFAPENVQLGGDPLMQIEVN